MNYCKNRNIKCRSKGCDRTAKCKGLCESHYQIWFRHKAKSCTTCKNYEDGYCYTFIWDEGRRRIYDVDIGRICRLYKMKVMVKD